MADRGLTRAQDAAIRMPGITEAPAPGNGGTSLVARGFVGHNSVAQLVDGTRLVVASGTVTYPFSTWPLESVEVLRGPASVLYGDGAIGAAVNYVTKKPIWNDTQREAFLGVGSYGLVQGGVGLRGPVNDVLAYSLYVDAERSDGYRPLEDVMRRNYALAFALKPTSSLKATFSVDGGPALPSSDKTIWKYSTIRSRQAIGCCVPADEAARQAGLKPDSARLGMYGGRSVWRVL